MSVIEIKPYRAEKYIMVTRKKRPNKLFQIIFGKHGSVFVNFPYFENSKGMVSLVKYPSNTRVPIDLSLVDGGKVTSHLVKYSHPPDGRAHFSQDGKVRTQIRKNSVPLQDINGHFFTIQLQGTDSFEKLDRKDYKSGSLKQIVNLPIGPREPPAIKIVGRLYSIDELKSRRFILPVSGSFGHVIEIVSTSGGRNRGFLLAPPLNNPSQDLILILACEIIPKIDAQENAALTFMGGFDHHDTIHNTSVETSYLALSYPLSDNDFEQFKKRIGCIDLVESDLFS